MKRTFVAPWALVAATILGAAAPARADLMELKWATEGYFRTRTVLLTNLAREPRQTLRYPVGNQQIVIPEIRNTSYIISRLRLMPTLSYAKLAKLTLQFDGIDDVLWGDNNAISSAPLFAVNGSNQYYLGGPERRTIDLTRAWVEFQIPVGIMRVGRMPSHWGMGILANGGGSANVDPTTPPGEPTRKSLDYFFDDDFGDNHFGSTNDRILFLTKPLSIIRTARKAKDTSSNFIVGYAFDKLSEAPLLANEPFERTFRPFGEQGFISRGSNDDANEHVFLAIYNQPDWDQVRYSDELRIGTYWVIRHETEGSTEPGDLAGGGTCGEFEGEPVPCVDTGSLVVIADFWYRIRYGNMYSEAEAVGIRGKSFGGVPFPTANKKKKANINGAVWRGGWLTDRWDALLEVGYASGDDDLGDENFKQRALHPDYNVGLILFEDILRELSARRYGIPFFTPANPDGAKGLMSNGGVINARYIQPKGRFRPGIGGLEVVGAVLLAWVDDLADTGASMYGYSDELDSTYLGTEVDIAVKSRFMDNHMDFSLETGYLRFGGALKSAYPDADSSFSLQTRLAFIW